MKMPPVAGRMRRVIKKVEPETGMLVVLNNVFYRLHSPLGPRKGWAAVKVGGEGSLINLSAKRLRLALAKAG